MTCGSRFQTGLDDGNVGCRPPWWSLDGGLGDQLVLLVDHGAQQHAVVQLAGWISPVMLKRHECGFEQRRPFPLLLRSISRLLLLGYFLGPRTAFLRLFSSSPVRSRTKIKSALSPGPGKVLPSMLTSPGLRQNSAGKIRQTNQHPGFLLCLPPLFPLVVVDASLVPRNLSHT